MKLTDRILKAAEKLEEWKGLNRRQRRLLAAVNSKVKES